MQLVVLGMHRSGTSVLANVLNLMGAYFGPEGASTGANEENPRGFWERRDVRNLNDLVLHSVGCDWDRIAGFRLKTLPRTTQASFESGAMKLLHEMDAHKPWVLKEPRLCLLFPLWARYFETPICIHICRNPLEVAKSLQARNGIPITAGLALWEKYNLLALSASENFPRIFVSHHQLITSPQLETGRVFDRLEELGVKGLQRPTDDVLSRHIDLQLYRQRKHDLDPASFLNAPQLKLFQTLTNHELASTDIPFQESATCQSILLEYEAGLQAPPAASVQSYEGGKSRGDLPRFKRWVSGIQYPLRSSRGWWGRHRQKLLIDASGLFDRSWYLSEYPDIRDAGVDPVRHYLKFGAREGRNPSCKFNTHFYLEGNPDVKASGFNPLVHYILHGADEGREAIPDPSLASDRYISQKIDVIVTVFNALNDVKKCLRSLSCTKDGFWVEIIVVNDGSDDSTTKWLREFCANRTGFQLIEHEENRGYTAAVNSGLKASNSPFVVLLNSDTVVCQRWLKGLVACMQSDGRIGISGPLSNAASWQSIPVLFDAQGQFCVNALPENVTPDDMASIVHSCSEKIYPRVPFINGFCFMIRKQLIEDIGFMDEKAFPAGYGEENDFCIRALDAGYLLAIADDAYVYHSKSKSFGHARRKQLTSAGSAALLRKHGKKYHALVDEIKASTGLESVRTTVLEALNETGTREGAADYSVLNVLFILPARGGGGSHSVVQEAAEMRKIGVKVRVAVNAQDLEDVLDDYRDIPDADKFIIGFTPENILRLSQECNVVVATVYHTVGLLSEILRAYPHILPAYYVQDYEPLFFSEGSEEWRNAFSSYGLIPDSVLFAKTHWIANIVEKHHRVSVNKVSPSIDHSVYKPVSRSIQTDVIKLAAMIRPQTPRRGAERTMRVLSKLNGLFRGRVAFEVFGCTDEDLRSMHCPLDFDFTNHGVISRPGVAAVLACCDIFIDLSDYQAFGRTALEAMACGCTAVVPRHGGADEYARDGENCLVVDSFDEDRTLNRISSLLANPAVLSELRQQGLKTAKNYSVEMTARDEAKLFLSHL